ncbi:IQ domain-containing protein IQM1-like [Neltuma alba]|uniref:IQ domain-containing protein IQM1-like n=1 Tax=Neltuma alba TaxID=207710 RepID=UPI0010A403DE|nr:IQ domain-containing protein IQM1-like [Prosopis alba]
MEMPALRIAGIDQSEEEGEMALRISSSSFKLERFDEKNPREESKCEERKKKVKTERLQIALLLLKFLASQDCGLEGWKALYSSGGDRWGRTNNESRSEKSKSAVCKWARIGRMAAKVGKGLSKDDKGQKLALRHWLEVIDTHHRYGHNLQFYYNVWVRSQSAQPFFHWLDDGDGKDLDLEKCPRSELQRQCIHYCKPEERRAYEVIIRKGKLVYRKSNVPVHTPEGSKWIFVLSTSRTLYIAEKKKGFFHHSSFLAGGATIASGRLVASHGVLHAIWPYSGHYCPTEKHFQEFINFLKKHKVDFTNVKTYAVDDDVPPSKPVVDEELQGDCRVDDNNVNGSHQREEAIIVESSSQVKEKKPLLVVSSKRTACVGPRINGYGRDHHRHQHQYPISIKVPPVAEFENLHISARVNVSHGKVCRKASIPIPSPASVAPKLHLSSSPDQIVRMEHPAPRLRVPAN